MCELLTVSGPHECRDDDPICVFIHDTDTYFHHGGPPKVGQTVVFPEGPRQITWVGSMVWRDNSYHSVRF